MNEYEAAAHVRARHIASSGAPCDPFSRNREIKGSAFLRDARRNSQLSREIKPLPLEKARYTNATSCLSRKSAFVISPVYSVRYTPETRVLIKTLHANPPTLTRRYLRCPDDLAEGERSAGRRFIGKNLSRPGIKDASISVTSILRQCRRASFRRFLQKPDPEPSCGRRRQRPPERHRRVGGGGELLIGRVSQGPLLSDAAFFSAPRARRE